MTVTVELIPGKDVVTIGESATNEIGINLKRTEPIKATVKVRVRCGSEATDLLDSNTAAVIATYSVDGSSERPYGNYGEHGDSKPESGERAWWTGRKPKYISGAVLISLRGFASNSPPGETTITVDVGIFEGKAKIPSTKESFTCTVKKSPDGSGGAKIHYFTVDPDYVLYAGQTPVTVRYYATGPMTTILFRNNEEIPAQFLDKTGDEVRFVDKPSITSVYRLEGRYADEQNHDQRKIISRTVQVVSPGWNGITLPQGSPIRLFASKEKLYGIFMDRKDDERSQAHYTLYSSVNGVKGWKLEDGDTPQHMATSPGVHYNGKLWLIGGSSADPTVESDEVWCYEEGEGWNQKPLDSPMPRRMGHVCVVFPRESVDEQGNPTIEEEIWVLGGYVV